MHTIDTIQQIKKHKEQGLTRYSISRKLNILWSIVDYWWDRSVPVAQQAEATDLKSVQCEFESHPGYQQAGVDTNRWE